MEFKNGGILDEFFWIILICSILGTLFVGFIEKDVVEGLGIGIPILAFGFLITVVMICIINFKCDDIEKGLNMVINNEMTNEQIEDEIESLTQASTDWNSYDLVVNINDVNTNGLTIKNINMEFKYSLLEEYIYLNFKKSFKLYVKSNNSQINNIEKIN